MSAGGRASQRKGAEAERELARLLRGYGYEVERGGSLSYGTVPDLTGLPGLHIEAKRCERLALPAWVEQAEADAARFRDGVPVVVFRQSREPWRVCLRLSDFMEIYKKTAPPLRAVNEPLPRFCGGCVKSHEKEAEET